MAEELSQRQVLSGSRAAVLPVGSFEVHNLDLPLGTDTFIAQAVAQLVCQKYDTLLLPPITYTYAGVTAQMPGTISVDLTAMAAYVEAVLTAMLRAGFGPLVVISGHGGNEAPCIAAVEQVFHRQQAGLLFCHVLGSGNLDLITKVWGASDPNLAENCALWAAWQMQGRPEVLRPKAESKLEGKPEVLGRLASAGHVPHTYNHPNQHIAVRDEGTPAQGLEFLTLVAERIGLVLPDLEDYHRGL